MINKLAKNIVILVGLCCCLLVFLLNIIYVSQIGDTTAEIVSTNIYGAFNTLITILIIIGILSISKKIEQINLNPKVKLTLLLIFIIIYSIFQIYWINIRQATPAWDQGSVYSIAVKMYENKWEELKNSQYLELCPQQITIAATFSGIFKLLSSSSVKIIQYANVISNALTVVGIILITKILEKQYKINNSLVLILIGTFFTLPLLSTFVYGDLISITMCLFAIYFIMKYGIEKKKRYSIISAIFMAIGYTLRMNNLIFIIALSIYLILNIFKKDDEEKNYKFILKQILILAMFIIIALVPATILRSSIQSKLDLDKDKKIPTLGYLYMGMEESYRANGWYSDYASWAWDDVEASKEKYKNALIERLKYFAKDPKYFVKFYLGKISSMWTENTYASLWYNQTFNFDQTQVETDIIRAEQIDKLVKDKTERLLMYQKALIIIIFGGTILVIIKNRKELSNEMILLITIFIGGFLFHILWEAKSRYIIPYLLVLIPVAAISIDSWKSELTKMKDIIEKIVKKVFTKEIILYAIFGVLTTIVNLVTFWILESILNWNENISNIIAIITSILFAYFTNSIWVFNSQAKNYKEKLNEFARFISGRCLTMVIEFIGCFLLFKTPIPTMISKLVVTVIVIILNFFISKFFAFKNSGKEEIKNEKN